MRPHTPLFLTLIMLVMVLQPVLAMGAPTIRDKNVTEPVDFELKYEEVLVELETKEEVLTLQVYDYEAMMDSNQITFYYDEGIFYPYSLGWVAIRPGHNPSYGEDEPYLGQVVDSYETNDSVAFTYQTVHNQTLGAMELNYYEDVPAYEDFTLYTEADGDNRLIRESPVRIVMDGLRRGDETTYIRMDYGAGYFGLNFNYSWVFNITSAEAGDADSRTWLRLWAVTVANLPTDAGARIMLNLDQVGANDGIFTLELYIRNGAGGADNDVSVNLDVGTPYYMTLERDGDDVTTWIRTGSLGGPLVDTLTTSFVNYNDVFALIYFPMRKNSPVDPNDWISGTFEYLWNGSLGDFYPDGGYYYTEELVGGDQALTLMYNASLSNNTAMTLELSPDNSTWVNHNNASGYEGLVAGLESVDLRDLNTTSLYVRVNMTTTDTQATPRMYQFRLVTVTTIISVATVSTAPYLVLAIILLMLGLVLGMRLRT